MAPFVPAEPLGEGAEPEPGGLYGPEAGTVWLIAVRFTGAGALAAVSEVFTPGERKTPWPPAPAAEVLGARKGTYCAASRLESDHH